MTAATHPPGDSADLQVPEVPDARALARSSRRGALELLGNLTLREIRTQYKRTALGRLWSFINPLATLGILSLVFGLVFRTPINPGTNSGIHVFALFLAAALIPWNFISLGINSGMNALVVNAGLLTKVYFPRYVLVLSVILSGVVTFLTEMSVVLVVMAIFGGPRVLIFIPGLLLMVIITTAFVTGLALMLSVAIVYFRDTQHLVGLGLQIWFYATPIIYPLTMVQDIQSKLAKEGTHIPLTTLWSMNPVYPFSQAYRAMLYDFAWPEWQYWAGSLAWALVALTGGLLVFRKFSARVVEEL